MKTVLITGGSSGIGFEMSRIWGQQGYRLLWVSHNKEELENAKHKLQSDIDSLEIHTYVQDLTADDGPMNVYKWSSGISSIDVLINNAGFGTYGYLHEINMEQEISMIKLNAIGLYKTTRFFLNDMIKENEGTIINICSNSAFQPVPRMTTYAATKGFVFQFSRGLQEELIILKSKVKVLTVCPSAIRDTPFRRLLSSDVKTFEGLVTTTAHEVASDVWKGFLKGKSLIVTGQKMRILYAIRGLIPAPMTRFLIRKETEKL